MCNRNEKPYNKDVLINEFNKNNNVIKEVEQKLGAGNSLKDFYDHYLETHRDNLVNLESELLNNVFLKMKDECSIHSIRSRVKNPYHLLDKLIRKIKTNTGYSGINIDNYHLYFDDLLGFRLLLLYNENWSPVHDYILYHFGYDKNGFVDKNKRTQLDRSKTMIISMPEANIRNGDEESLYLPKVQEGELKIKRGRYYRSVHYSVFYKGYCFEIQVRSLFDEAWGEIDHDILYPLFLDNKDLIDYSKLINRISGIANEMSSYFKYTIIRNTPPSGTPTLHSVPDELTLSKQNDNRSQNILNTNGSGNPHDAINKILGE